MADYSDEKELLGFFVISLGVVALTQEKVIKKKTRVKKRFWMKEWLHSRFQKGAYNGIINELRLQDQEDFRKFLRMNTETL